MQKQQKQTQQTPAQQPTQPDLSKSEAVVAVLPDEVPFKNTTLGKTIRTFFQNAAAVLLVLALSDEFRNFVTNRYPELAVFLPLATALFTAVQNGADKSVKNF